MEKKKKEDEAAVQFEICVCCRKKLDIPADMELDFRPFYIEGSGQLCYDCYHEIYGK